MAGTIARRDPGVELPRLCGGIRVFARLMAIERADLDFLLNFAALFIMVTVGFWLVRAYGPIGAAIGLLVATFVTSAVKAGAFLRLRVATQKFRKPHLDEFQQPFACEAGARRPDESRGSCSCSSRLCSSSFTTISSNARNGIGNYDASEDVIAGVVAEGSVSRRIALVSLAIFAIVTLIRHRADGALRIKGSLGWILLGYAAWAIVSPLWAEDRALTLTRVTVFAILCVAAVGHRAPFLTPRNYPVDVLHERSLSGSWRLSRGSVRDFSSFRIRVSIRGHASPEHAGNQLRPFGAFGDRSRRFGET